MGETKTYTFTAVGAVPPEGFEFTGEIRPARQGEYYCDLSNLKHCEFRRMYEGQTDDPYAILRPLPAPITVTLPAETWGHVLHDLDIAGHAERHVGEKAVREQEACNDARWAIHAALKEASDATA